MSHSSVDTDLGGLGSILCSGSHEAKIKVIKAGPTFGSSGRESSSKQVLSEDWQDPVSSTRRTMGPRFLFPSWFLSNHHPQQLPTTHTPAHVARSTFKPKKVCKILSCTLNLFSFLFCICGESPLLCKGLCD